MRPIRRDGMTVHKIAETETSLPLAMMFADARKDDLDLLRRWYGSPGLTDDPATAQVVLSVHSYILQCGSLTILVDGCNGNDKTRSVPFADHLQTGYLANLYAAGVSPADVDIVLCTHLHCDHVGWNTRLVDGRWVPTFPNARYLFSRQDYEHFAKVDAEPLHREAFFDSVLPVVEAGLAEMVDQDHRINSALEDGIWLEDAAGHSPGSVVLRAGKSGRQLLFTGDVMHHPLQLVRPALSTFADHDPQQARLVRERICRECADTEAIVLPTHFDGTSAGMIRSYGDGYRMEFVA